MYTYLIFLCCITFLSKFQVQNKLDFIKLEEELEGLTRVKWQYVPAHSGVPGNEIADKLAYQGALKYIPPKFAWDDTVDQDTVSDVKEDVCNVTARLGRVTIQSNLRPK